MELISFIRKKFNLTVLLIEHDMKPVTQNSTAARTTDARVIPKSSIGIPPDVKMIGKCENGK